MTSSVPPIALSIAGSDPSGGAGLQADLKVFQQFKVFGTTVITLITAQNSGGVSAVHLLSPKLVEQQFQAVFSDVPPCALKTGALGSVAVMEVVADQLKRCTCPRVLDPVMVSKHGHPLIDNEAIAFFRQEMLPLADLITPNRFELECLVGTQIVSVNDALNAGRRLQDLGARNCLLKIGNLAETQHLLAVLGDNSIQFEKPHVTTQSLHGTGCALSANITARLALGQPLTDAIEHAIDDIHQAITHAPLIGKQAQAGEGFGPIDLHFSPYNK